VPATVVYAGDKSGAFDAIGDYAGRSYEHIKEYGNMLSTGITEHIYGQC
jgi:hypothetical protein